MRELGLGNFLSGMETRVRAPRQELLSPLETSLVEWKPLFGAVCFWEAVPWKLP